MTTLKDIFDHLAHGELSQSEIGGFNPEEYESEVDPRRYAQLITYINSALNVLYTQFWLGTGELVLQPVEGVEFYKLSRAHALSNVASAETKWIMDTPENPYRGDLMHIEEIYDEGGNMLPLNRLDVEPEFQFFTPSWNVLQVPYVMSWNQIAVMYRAAPEKVIWTSDIQPEEVEVGCPPQLLEALLFYCAHKHFSGLNFDQGQQSTAYYQKYIAQVDMVNNQGLFIQPDWNNWRFDDNGWR